jgi:hypothetical protein
MIISVSIAAFIGGFIGASLACIVWLAPIARALTRR